MTINQESDTNHQEIIAKLITDYKEVFGTNCEKLGRFPHEVSIITEPNKTVYVKQHPIAAAYKKAVSAEIQNMEKSV